MNSLTKYNYVINCGFKPDTLEINPQGCKFLLYQNIPPVIEAGNGENRVLHSGGSWTFLCHTKDCWLLNHKECSLAEKESNYEEIHPEINKICL